ncbi:hypothetical protein J2T16_003115 [Paenibacillus intestini]|nr:hypothetical protein [Paenibacillus intestini]
MQLYIATMYHDMNLYGLGEQSNTSTPIKEGHEDRRQG